MAELSIFWDQMIQLIEEGKVVPIVGQDVLTVRAETARVGTTSLPIVVNRELFRDFLSSTARELARRGVTPAHLPALFLDTGAKGWFRYTEFFTARIRNPNTRAAYLQAARQFSDWCDMAGLVAGDRYLVVNPFFHMFGYKAGCLASLMQGATIHFRAVAKTDFVTVAGPDQSFMVENVPPTVSIDDLPDTVTRKQLGRRRVLTVHLTVSEPATITLDILNRKRKSRRQMTVNQTSAGSFAAQISLKDIEGRATLRVTAIDPFGASGIAEQQFKTR